MSLWKGEILDTQTLIEGRRCEDVQKEDGPLQAKERGPEESLPSQPSKELRQSISVLQFVVIFYANPSKLIQRESHLLKGGGLRRETRRSEGSGKVSADNRPATQYRTVHSCLRFQLRPETINLFIE